MAERYFPFASGAGMNANEADWRTMWLGIGTPGVIIGQLGELLVTSSGGNQIAAAAGIATAYGTGYINDAPKTLTVSPNGNASSRYDRVVVQFDMLNDIVQTVIVPGRIAPLGPFDLLNDPTNKVEVSLAVLAVPPGSGAVSSGNIFPALDRWATPTNESLAGMIEPFFGLQSSIPKLYVQAAGQTGIVRWSYEKLWAVFPDVADPPYHGKVSAFNTMVFPDLRGRTIFGLDNMGGSDAGRLATASVLGNQVGSNVIDPTRVPHHFHKLLPRRGHSDDMNSLVPFMYGKGPNNGVGSFTDVPTGTGVKLNDLNQMFSDWGIAVDDDGDAHTEYGPNYDPATGDSTQSDDSAVPSALMGHFVLRVA